ncbi:polyhydroxyalkanoate synthesis repressor PhaR [Acidisoma cellulosilytica]|uniref:Polyhydroxyalkanoate synthesis repressor PhaR n=1 Tax=Acidisoma cellulosilyticum TaxID=2802395 RepID=A0A963Z7J3_9PROT|nr:polyhydroxyalkanoate synthesis repressor PhaR [Acidisoma cellulosilyticum]MCB8883283.1 polyhydroxyalkanoate synthesis repressor PhaR [Acidisoma cellulosilyticum]
MSQGEKPAGAPDAPVKPPVVVKKYANRRLYNTESSSYITLDNLAMMVREGRDFIVYDAKSGEDITRSVLTQIIVEEESKGSALLPTAFLRNLIGFYGDSMQGVLPRYLEQSMANFTQQQQQVRAAMQQTVGTLFPFDLEQVSRQNIAMMERAMTMFTPFYREPEATSEPSAEAQPKHPNVEHELTLLRGELARLQKELGETRAQLADQPVAKTKLDGRTAAD